MNIKQIFLGMRTPHPEMPVTSRQTLDLLMRSEDGGKGEDGGEGVDRYPGGLLWGKRRKLRLLTRRALTGCGL